MITLRKKYTDSFNFVFNKRVILRVDFNVPVVDGEISDLTRIEKILPTIQDLLEHKAKILLISHFGRPDGQKNEEYSLKKLVSVIKKVLNQELYFLDDDIRKIKSEKVRRILNTNNIILFENIRFYKEELLNDENFSKHLSTLGEIFINDSFSCSHRAHSSIVGIPKFLPSFPGKLLEDEVKNLKKIINNNISNNVVILGGSKVSTKLEIIEFLIKKFDRLLIGGAMANTFFAAKGLDIGASLYEKSMIKTAKFFLKDFEQRLVLPEDVVVDSEGESIVKNLNQILKHEKIFDIGPRTRMRFHEIISNSESILWNGPLGKFEQTPFDAGTKFVAGAIKQKKNKNFFSVAGGGDTISMLKRFDFFKNFSYVSTGGGAFLEFIQGTDLPGLIYLNK
tara:strand:+ start:861 stop:2042 length:1182 start_codon:yes stop_codon:yes gene_type:complete